MNIESEANVPTFWLMVTGFPDGSFHELCWMRSHEELRKTLSRYLKDAQDKRLTKMAVFYGEKLLTISSDVEDVYAAALAFHDDGEFRRAATILSKTKLPLHHRKCLYLAVKCLLECDEQDECEQLLELAKLPENEESMTSRAQDHYTSSLFLLRGHLAERRENFDLALRDYSLALRLDPFCYDAFHALIMRKLLPVDQQKEFIANLSCLPSEEWIKALYHCMGVTQAEKFEARVHTIDDLLKIGETENPPTTVCITSEVEHGDEAMDIAVSAAKEDSKSDKEDDDDDCISIDVRLQDGLRKIDLSIDIQKARAKWYFHHGDFVAAYHQMHQILALSPDVDDIYPIHLSVCLELKKQNEIYQLAHDLSRKDPESAVGAYAIGMYYFCIKHYSSARKAFDKAKFLDPSFFEAWLAFANVFAVQMEITPAIKAYRAMIRRFPGAHLPRLYLAMEQLKAREIDEARLALHQAFIMCPDDPLVLNGRGYLSYSESNYPDAVERFQEAISVIPKNASRSSWVNIYINLGHALRKQRRFLEALKQYNEALKYASRESSLYTAIGFTHHLMHNYDLAIEHYESALRWNRADRFAEDMLTQALFDKMLFCTTQDSI